MSKHKKRVSLAQRATESQPVPEPRGPAPQEAASEVAVAEVEEEASAATAAETLPEVPVAEEPATDGPGIESNPLFWFVLGALTVGIIVLLGLLLMLPGSAMPAAKAAPVATNPAVRPGTATAVAAANALAKASTPNLEATMTAVTRLYESVPRMSLDEAKRKIDAGSILVVDVRSSQSFESQHIKGAINVPEADTEARLAELPKDKEILLYCAWPNENESVGSALILYDKGYSRDKVKTLKGGWGAWLQAEYPTEP